MLDDPDDLEPLLFRVGLVAVARRVCQDVQLHAVLAAILQIRDDARFVVRLVVDFCAGVRKAGPRKIDFAKPGGEPLRQFGEGCRIVRLFRQVMPNGEFRSGNLF